MDIVIKNITRSALEDSIEKYIEILKDVRGEYWGREHFLTDLPGKFQLSCCALLDNQLVGYIISSEKGTSRAHIHKFMVDKKHRSKRIGHLLLNYYEGLVKKKNIGTITLKVNLNNYDAIRFYLNHGFLVEAQCEDSKTSDALIKMKKLI
ncbi:MAG TPA: GNAT family N-acetyltransferase [Ignavibacteria bacterium]